MRRTVLSSFLFIYPLNHAYHYRDLWMVNLCAIAVGLSVANHSHTWHGNPERRKLFRQLDIAFMYFLLLYVIYPCFVCYGCIVHTGMIVSIIAFIYFIMLGGKVKQIEDYNAWQKNGHVLFHVVSIVGLTKLRERCYWNYDAMTCV